MRNKNRIARQNRFTRSVRRCFGLFANLQPTRAFERLEVRSLLSAMPLVPPETSDEKPHVLWAADTPQSVVDRWEEQFAAAGAEIDNVDGQRWSSTATDGGGLRQGHPSTLTWSVVPDGTRIDGFTGEPAAPSDLRARLDALYGSMTTWLSLFQGAFDRWEAVSGIDFVYEPKDDGVSYSSSNSGALGRRGDIRIGGHFVDGNSNVLAYNFFPNMGDMVIDTADSFFDNLSSNSLNLRNVVSHELGHGLGLEHSLPVAGTKLMEPHLSLSFDGPQHDDILRINRGYGDRLEGNDTAATASDLGLLTSQPITVSTVSIDDDSDVDYYTFSIDTGSLVDFTLAPFGSVYTVGLEGGSNSTFDSRAQSDLSLTILAANDTSVLGSANATGLGGSELLVDQNLAAGQYYVRVNGAHNAAQLYTLSLLAERPSYPPVLSPVGNQTMTSSQDALVINLTASDANGDPLTFSAAGQSLEYHLDQTLGLGSSGNEYLNWGGRNEKWLTGSGDSWYYITPNGKLYRWLGGSLANDPLIEQVSTAAYANTSLLYNAQPNNSPATLSINGSTLIINPNDRFGGKFYVTVTVSDGAQVDSEVFWVEVQPAATDATPPMDIPVAPTPPVLSPIGNQTMPSSQDALVINLTASDANGDPLTFSAVGQSVEYYLDQTLGLGSSGNEYFNWGGRNEKWLTGANAWHYITPDGKLYRWLGGSLANDPLVEQVSTAAYANTSLLYNAQPNNAPAILSVNGNTLTINPHDGYRGKFYVTVAVSDGNGGTDSEQFTVAVT